jgi:hypothetical protein
LCAVGFRHGYLFTFLVALEATGAFAEVFAPGLPFALEPFFFAASGSGLSMVVFVSPK